MHTESWKWQSPHVFFSFCFVKQSSTTLDLSLQIPHGCATITSFTSVQRMKTHCFPPHHTYGRVTYHRVQSRIFLRSNYTAIAGSFSCSTLFAFFWNHFDQMMIFLIFIDQLPKLASVHLFHGLQWTSNTFSFIAKIIKATCLEMGSPVPSFKIDYPSQSRVDTDEFVFCSFVFCFPFFLCHGSLFSCVSESFILSTVGFCNFFRRASPIPDRRCFKGARGAFQGQGFGWRLEGWSDFDSRFLCLGFQGLTRRL